MRSRYRTWTANILVFGSKIVKSREIFLSSLPEFFRGLTGSYW